MPNDEEPAGLTYGPHIDGGFGGRVISAFYIADLTRPYDAVPDQAFFRDGGIGGEWPTGFRGFHTESGGFNGDWFCQDLRANSSICYPPYEVGVDSVDVSTIPINDGPGLAWPIVDFREVPDTPEGRVQVAPGALLNGVGIDPPPDFMALRVSGLRASFYSAHFGCYVNPDIAQAQGCGPAILLHPEVKLTVDGPPVWAMGMFLEDDNVYGIPGGWGTIVDPPIIGVDPSFHPDEAGEGGVTGRTRYEPPFPSTIFGHRAFDEIKRADTRVVGLVPPLPEELLSVYGYGEGFIVNPAYFDDPSTAAYQGDPTNSFTAALWPLGTFGTVEIDYGDGDWYGQFSGGMEVVASLYWIPKYEEGRNPGNVLIGPVTRGVRIRHRIVGRSASL